MIADQSAIYLSEFARKKKNVEIAKAAYDNAMHELRTHRTQYRIIESTRILLDLDNRIDEYEKTIKNISWTIITENTKIGDEIDNYYSDSDDRYLFEEDPYETQLAFVHETPLAVAHETPLAVAHENPLAVAHETPLAVAHETQQQYDDMSKVHGKKRANSRIIDGVRRMRRT
jgi:hypothetical protein